MVMINSGIEQFWHILTTILTLRDIAMCQDSWNNLQMNVERNPEFFTLWLVSLLTNQMRSILLRVSLHSNRWPIFLWILIDTFPPFLLAVVITSVLISFFFSNSQTKSASLSDIIFQHLSAFELCQEPKWWAPDSVSYIRNLSNRTGQSEGRKNTFKSQSQSKSSKLSKARENACD